MINQIIHHFPNCTIYGCNLLCTEKIFQVIEPHVVNGRCIIDNLTIEPNFVVRNPNEEEIYFIAVDGCLMLGYTNRRCDFILFSKNKFSFIEIKDSNSIKRRTRNSLIKKAYDQLEITIKLLQADINFAGYNVDAIIAFKTKPAIPASSASNLNKRFYFKKKYNVDLKEGTEKTFD